MHHPIARHMLVWSGLIVSCAGSAHARANEGAPSAAYYYFKEARALPLDLSRVAVLDETGQGVLEGDPGVTRATLAGWWFIEVPGTMRSEAGIRAICAEPGRIEALGAAAVRAGGVMFVSPVFFGEDAGPVYPSPRIVVRFEEGVPGEHAQRFIAAARAGEVIARDVGAMSNCFLIRSGATDGWRVLADANMLAQQPIVRFAEPDMRFTGRAELIPNDPGFPSCWGLYNTGTGGGQNDFDMDVAEAWDVQAGSSSIKVVIIDTGVQQDHPDIHQVPGTDTTFQPGVAGGPNNACDNHGTPVAGCVSAFINNALGTCGVAPGCVSASARTFVSNTPCAGGWSSGVIETLNTLSWAQSIGARVTNNSNYYGFQSSSIADSYATTRANGMVHFASAGNDASSQITYPSSLPSVNAVAALASNGTRASFSNFGNGLAFSAPGANIYSTDRTGTAGYYSDDYGLMNGTSFASPYTAGVAALILSQFPALSSAQVEGLMQSTCTDLGATGYDTGFGWGMPNAYVALTGSPPPPPPAPGPFNLLSPANGATGVSLTPTLDWSDSSGAASYVVTVDNDADFSSPIISAAITPSQIGLTPGTLSQGVTYYWKVVARNVELLGTPSTPAFASFTTFAPPPPCRGDINRDGHVNTIDLTLLIAGFGQSVTPGTGGDLNADGLVNTQDLTLLLAEFGRSNCP